MKLATLRDGSRDGRLVVVSRDLTRASDARHIAPTLRAALDDWDRAAPQLELIARGIEAGGQPVERFHERDALSPLPAGRAADRRFGDPRGAIVLPAGALDSGIVPGLAVIVGDLRKRAGARAARAAVRLVMLAGTEAGGDAGFSPVAVTPDELAGARLLVVDLNGSPFARTDAAADLGATVAEAARGGPLAAGDIVGPDTAGARPVPLRAGDTVRIEVRDAAGHSIFGAIERTVAAG